MKNSTKAKPELDFEVLHIGLLDAVICTRLPIKQAEAKLQRENPAGTTANWRFDGKKKNQAPCSDGQGKTHYRLFC